MTTENPTIPPAERAAHDEAYRRAYFARAAAREARQAARDQAKATAAATGRAAGGSPTAIPASATEASLTIALPKSLSAIVWTLLFLFRAVDRVIWFGWQACAILTAVTLLGIVIGLLTV